jgi:excisionase family DNA binding protein
VSATKPEKAKDRSLKRLYTVEEAGQYLGRSAGAVRALIYKGRLSEVRLDRRVYIDIHDLDAMVDECKMRFGE